MVKKGTEDLDLEKRMTDSYPSLSAFWRKNFKPDKFMAFDTARRAIKAKKDVSLPNLMVLMQTLGYGRSQIVDALKDRGDSHYWRLIEPVEGAEENLPAAERKLLDDARQLRTGNRTLYNALITIIDALRSATPMLLTAPGNSPLHVLAGTRVDPATRQEFVEAIKLRLSPLEGDAKKTVIDARNEYGATPLIYACMAGNEEIAVLLMEHGADGTIKDKDGMTALHYAHRLHLGKVLPVLKEKHPEMAWDYWVEP